MARAGEACHQGQAPNGDVARGTRACPACHGDACPMHAREHAVLPYVHPHTRITSGKTWHFRGAPHSYWALPTLTSSHLNLQHAS